MTDEFKHVDRDIEKIKADIHKTTWDLNAALRQFKNAGGNLKGNATMFRLLAQTELFLKEQGA